MTAKPGLVVARQQPSQPHGTTRRPSYDLQQRGFAAARLGHDLAMARFGHDGEASHDTYYSPS